MYITILLREKVCKFIICCETQHFLLFLSFSPWIYIFQTCRAGPVSNNLESCEKFDIPHDSVTTPCLSISLCVCIWCFISREQSLHTPRAHFPHIKKTSWLSFSPRFLQPYYCLSFVFLWHFTHTSITVLIIFTLITVFSTRHIPY